MFFGLMLIIFTCLYLMVHGLGCSECVGKGWNFSFEELGTVWAAQSLVQMSEVWGMDQSGMKALPVFWDGESTSS